jgi:hypothetical protein
MLGDPLDLDVHNVGLLVGEVNSRGMIARTSCVVKQENPAICDN